MECESGANIILTGYDKRKNYTFQYGIINSSTIMHFIKMYIFFNKIYVFEYICVGKYYLGAFFEK